MSLKVSLLEIFRRDFPENVFSFSSKTVKGDIWGQGNSSRYKGSGIESKCTKVGVSIRKSIAGTRVSGGGKRPQMHIGRGYARHYEEFERTLY